MTKISALTPLGDGLAVGDQFIIRDIDDAGTPNKSVTISGITRGLEVGTALAPSIAFAADKNTGIYGTGSDVLALVTAGENRLHITAGGLVGIGTSSPSESIHTTGKLRVGDGGNYTVAAVQLGASNANGISYPGTNILNFITNSTAALTIDASQRVGIGTNASNANGGILQLSGGITFPATAVAATDANTLDDYEEGTWTPVVTGWTSVTYTVQDGKYIKIGKHLTAWFYIQFSGTSAATNVTITGLPFTEETFSRGGSLTYYQAPLNETSGVLIYPAAGTITLYTDSDAGDNVQSNGNASGSYLIGSINSIRS